MDTPPAPRALRLLLDITRTPDARLEGQLCADTTEPWTAFSGVLELLKVLEEQLDHEREGANREAPTEGKEHHG